MSQAAPLELRIEDRLKLEDLLQSRRTPQRIRLRCRILLLAAEGVPNLTIAQRLQITRPTVIEWRHRYEQEGLQALDGRSPDHTESLQARISEIKDLLAAQTPDTPPWNLRNLAQTLGYSPTTLQRLLEAGGIRLNPRHRPSSPLEPHLLGQIVDSAGLYLHPPHHAIALRVAPPVQESIPCPPPQLPTASQGWTLLRHLRSIEALREMEGHTTHLSSNYWRFVCGLTCSDARDAITVISDTSLGPEYLRQLAIRQPNLHIAPPLHGVGWLDTMKEWILPALQEKADLGLAPNFSHLGQAMETFVRNETADPFLWISTPTS